MNAVPHKKTGVIQLIDTLHLGGAERMAVTLANLLPADCYRSYLCVTRSTGMLAAEIAPHVSPLFLARKSRFDLAAIRSLVRFIREQNIPILHAHGTSLFVAVIAARFVPSVKVIWHDHYGKKVTHRATLAERLFVRRADHLIVVTLELQRRAQSQLKLPAARVTYLPNFVSRGTPAQELSLPLPGSKEARILCVANIRPVKDQVTLLDAMRIVAQAMPHAHLLLVGSLTDTVYVEQIRQYIAAMGLQEKVSLLGARQEIAEILAASDIGVLSSASEGLPLALLEYGMAGLPVVVTDVGQCAEVVDKGNAGIVVPPRNSHALADALLLLLKSPEMRERYGAAFQQRVREHYSPDAGMCQLQTIYARLLEDARPQ